MNSPKEIAEKIVAEKIKLMEINDRMMGNFSSHFNELYNSLNNKKENYTFSKTQINDDDLKTISSFRVYRGLVDKTDLNFSTYLICTEIMISIFSSKSDYYKKNFSEKCMFWHDKIYDVINVVRLHNTVIQPPKYSSFMDYIVNAFKRDFLHIFKKTTPNGNNESMVNHFHAFEYGRSQYFKKSTFPDRKYFLIELLYKLSDIVRHQHDFFYEASIAKNNLLADHPSINEDRDFKEHFDNIVFPVTQRKRKHASFRFFFEIFNYHTELSEYSFFQKKIKSLIQYDTATIIFKKWMISFVLANCNVQLPKQNYHYRDIIYKKNNPHHDFI